MSEREAERAAIVEYIRECSDAEHDRGYGREAEALALLADNLERGDHLRADAG